MGERFTSATRDWRSWWAYGAGELWRVGAGGAGGRVAVGMIKHNKLHGASRKYWLASPHVVRTARTNTFFPGRAFPALRPRGRSMPPTMPPLPPVPSPSKKIALPTSAKKVHAFSAQGALRGGVSFLCRTVQNTPLQPEMFRIQTRTAATAGERPRTHYPLFGTTPLPLCRALHGHKQNTHPHTVYCHNLFPPTLPGKVVVEKGPPISSRGGEAKSRNYKAAELRNQLVESQLKLGREVKESRRLRVRAPLLLSAHPISSAPTLPFAASFFLVRRKYQR